MSDCTFIIAIILCGFAIIFTWFSLSVPVYMECSQGSLVDPVSDVGIITVVYRPEAICIDYEDIYPEFEAETELEEAVSTVSEANVEELFSEEIIYLAKTVWGEARGLNKTKQAAVIWTILNRVDSDISYIPDDIISVITQKYQYAGYLPDNPVDPEIESLAVDVITRWLREKNGEENVGRVLPKEYLYFHGDGIDNYFRSEYDSDVYWNWSIESPYV